MKDTVAQAIYGRDRILPVGAADTQEAWKRERPSVRERYRMLADVALMALRKPSKEMVQAGRGFLFVDEMFTAMVDEAMRDNNAI